MNTELGVDLLSRDDISRAIRRICHEIVESNQGLENCVVLGIPTRGALLAQRIGNTLAEIESNSKTPIPVGTLDITIYRDDLQFRSQKEVTPTTIPASGIDGKTVILVDDVLYSGRTVRAALDALRSHGRPQKVQLAVLIDRGHRELPIRADYVGKNLPSAANEVVKVSLAELDGNDGVKIFRRVEDLNKVEVSK